MTPEAIRDLLKRRYACRDYDPNRKISDQDFHMILEAGQLAPSSYGFEPWHFLVIESESLKQALAPIALGAQKVLASASHFVIILSRTQGGKFKDCLRTSVNLSNNASRPSRRKISTY